MLRLTVVLALASWSDAWALSSTLPLSTVGRLRHSTGVLHLRGGAAVKSKDQSHFIAERLSRISKVEVDHIFNDIDKDGNNKVTFEEMDFLASYFSPSSIWTLDQKKTIFEGLDKNKDQEISSTEFYEWIVLNTESITDKGSQTKLRHRQESLVVKGEDTIPKPLLTLLDEFDTGSVPQKVTHPLHSSFGRMLRDHFVATYLLLEMWGNPKAVVEAGLFHALYQRGDGLRAVDFSKTRPMLQEKLGKEVEELVYMFPSSHKSANEPDGLLHAPRGSDITVTDVLTGEKMLITDAQRKSLVELEVANSHDQNRLEIKDPVRNLWSFYQHANALPYMSKHARETIHEFQRRSVGATCEGIVEWHEGRFKEAGKEIPPVWERHLDMFRAGGRYHKVHEKLLKKGDKDQDGSIDWDEFVEFMTHEFKV